MYLFFDSVEHINNYLDPSTYHLPLSLGPGAQGSQKTMSNPLELELQVIMSHRAGTGK